VGEELGRRTFLKAVGVGGVLAFVPSPVWAAVRATAPTPGRPGRFLDAHELDTLRAVTSRLVPGPPDDPAPGALEAGAAEAIDALLGAFAFDPPLIHAGGPFSDRAGARNDEMAEFVPLDELAERGWRLRLEGSRGRPELEFAGPVVGLQELYRTGLADLDRRARPTATDYSSAPRQLQDSLLRDPAVADFATLVLSDTLDALYGAPEYHGNRRLVGWTANRWPGDVQPHGYADREVSEPDRDPGPALDAATARAELSKFVVGIEDLR
jgi:Gluconate 2-dehydrogenase subunit 3